jgi:hypothetical protein
MPTRRALVALWEGRRREADAKIDAAYWRFTRQRRGVPPVLVVPEAYRERAEAERQLRALRGVS